jgi:uncharacterized protein YdaU (DUF1376 family)
MPSLPYFAFYPADWLSSPRIMCTPLAQQAAYLRLLCACWLSGDCSLPDDDTHLAALSGLPRDEVKNLRHFFVIHPTKPSALTNPRLFSEWEKSQRITQKRSQAGKKSGKSRRTNNEHTANKTRTKHEQNANKTGTCVRISESYSDIRIQKSESESESESEKEFNPSAPDEKSAKISTRQRPRDTDESSSPIAETWRAYAAAYQARYGIPPVRNAKVNACLTRFARLIPLAEAPAVAAFYVGHPGLYYARRGHPVELMVRDAEKLRMEWAKNRPITEHEARQMDGRAARGRMWQELIEEVAHDAGTRESLSGYHGTFGGAVVEGDRPSGR